MVTSPALGMLAAPTLASVAVILNKRKQEAVRLKYAALVEKMSFIRNYFSVSFSDVYLL